MARQLRIWWKKVLKKRQSDLNCRFSLQVLAGVFNLPVLLSWQMQAGRQVMVCHPKPIGQTGPIGPIGC